jgi:type I restriction enzyme R subunit
LKECTRDQYQKNVFVLVDEPQTTGGDLKLPYRCSAKYPYIGFTGTPLTRLPLEKGHLSYLERMTPRRYADKYGMAESIEDGTTVKLHYTLALTICFLTRNLGKISAFAKQGISDIETSTIWRKWPI